MKEKIIQDNFLVFLKLTNFFFDFAFKFCVCGKFFLGGQGGRGAGFWMAKKRLF